jgi:hypothetical protein
MDCSVQEEEGRLQVYDQTVMSTTRTSCEWSPSYKGVIKLNLTYNLL